MDGLIQVVSGFSGKGYREYGHRLVKTLHEFMPSYSQVIYTHDMDTHHDWPGVEQREQNAIANIKNFIADHEDDPFAQGVSDPGGRWKAKEKQARYSYRFDAFKFCRMVFVMHDAIMRCDKAYMIWLDGDTVVRRAPPKAMLKMALPGGEAYAYLGRPAKYTETGFLFFDVERAKPILQTWADYYRLGTYRQESEWHSAWLFDRAREQHPDIEGYNLTPEGRGHAIHQCWVGLYFDHLKGKRKKRGVSPEAR